MSVDLYMRAAIEEAQKGLKSGGVPIGSVLVLDGKIIGRGHNQRIQKGSVILHAEMDCLENAGRRPAKDYQQAILYSTLSPCPMCTGAILLYGIKNVVIGENSTFKGPEEYSKSQGVSITNVDSQECKELMKKFIDENTKIWYEDIGIDDD